MDKKAFFLFVMLIPLSLSSCDKVVLNVSKPYEGREVSELTIPLKDDHETTFTYDMDSGNYIRSESAIKELKEINYDRTNWDCELHITAKKDDEQVFEYTVKNKNRYTDKGNKLGYYQIYECGNMVYKLSSYYASIQQIYGFSYAKEESKYISMIGNIPTESRFDSLKGYADEAVEPDLDYEPGLYYIDGLPYEPDIQSNPFSSYRGILIIRGILEHIFPANGGGWFSASRLISKPIGSWLQEKPIYSYKLTRNYLIVNFDLPYGMFYNQSLGSFATEEIIDKSIKNECYFKETMYFDVSTGLLAYLDVSFKTFDQLDHPRIFAANGYMFEGTFVFKTQKDSNEGYYEFMNIRKEVMKQCNNSQPK